MSESVMKLGLILSATDKMSRVIDQAVGRTTKKLQHLKESIDHTSHKSMIAGGVIVAGAFEAMKKAEGVAAAEARLSNVFKQMWGSSGAVKEASKQATEFAKKLSLTIGVDEETIMMTQAKLATFKNVSSKTSMMTGIFERATNAAHDLAATGFGEATGNAQKLGRALQDPMKGLLGMRKMISASDITHIQSIYKTKGLVAAQKAILDSIEHKVKGTAQVTAKATDIMKVGFEHVVEAIGGAFLPSADKAKNKFTSILPKVLAWVEHNHKLIQTIAKIGIALLAFGMAMKVVSFAITAFQTVLKVVSIGMKVMTAMQWLFNASLFGCPLVWIVVGIMAVVAAVYLLIKNWKSIVDWVKNSNNVFAKLIRASIYPVVIGFKLISAVVKAVISGVIKLVTWIKTSNNWFAKFIRGGVGMLIDSFKFLKDVIGWVIDKLSVVWEWIKKFTSNALAPLLKVIDLFSKGTQAELNVNTKTTGANSGSKVIKMMSTAVSNQSTNIKKSGLTSVNYSPTINISGSATPEDKKHFDKVLTDHKRDVIRIIKESNENNKRVAFAS